MKSQLSVISQGSIEYIKAIKKVITDLLGFSNTRFTKLITTRNFECMPINFKSIMQEQFLLNTTLSLPKLCSDLNREMEKKFLKAFYEIAYTCKLKCKMHSYFGEVIKNKDPAIGNRTVAIWYWTSSNTIEVEKQYLVLDLNGFIGYAGGTLGLFIGFSFFGILTWLLNTFKNVFKVEEI